MNKVFRLVLLGLLACGWLAAFTGYREELTDRLTRLEYLNNKRKSDDANREICRGRVTHPDRFDPTIHYAAALWDVSPALIKAVIMTESGFNPEAVSPAGAQGLMQIMPRTASSIGLENPFDPRENIVYGAGLLADHLGQYRSLDDALIAYNAGPSWVGRSVLPKETKRYIRVVRRHYRYYAARMGR